MAEWDVICKDGGCAYLDTNVHKPTKCGICGSKNIEIRTPKPKPSAIQTKTPEELVKEQMDDLIVEWGAVTLLRGLCQSFKGCESAAELWQMAEIIEKHMDLFD